MRCCSRRSRPDVQSAHDIGTLLAKVDELAALQDGWYDNVSGRTPPASCVAFAKELIEARDQSCADTHMGPQIDGGISCEWFDPGMMISFDEEEITLYAGTGLAFKQVGSYQFIGERFFNDFDKCCTERQKLDMDGEPVSRGVAMLVPIKGFED